ncbi:agglutinin biogenesis protein MshI [Dechloromonas sp. CZR5]|uniref:agglutinin biogenesis protein MshI n=1 Tax=Dechloromonas sp. CZR5 TaxID=2608630 RepID=UPI00123CE613|nr:agglutinin biogenesis protein MshI [Dechloromonas sp. CZR5]
MWPNFGAKRVEGWMSVVRMGDRLDLAHVITPVGKRPEIRLCESFKVGGQPDALSRLAQNKGLKRYRCATLLGESRYRMAQLEAPAVPPEERSQALRWRLKDMVDFPVDGAAIAVADIPTEGGRQVNVFAIVAPQAVVAEEMAAFDAAHVLLEAIDIPEMAVRNVAALFEEPNRGLAFLAMHGGESLLTITFGGELYLSRRIEVSAQALAETDADRRQQMLERLALELQRTLDNFDRQYGFISVSRLLVSSEFDCAGTVAQLAQNLYLPVQVADLSQVAEFNGIPELRVVERQAQSLLAIGAALRSDA